MRPSCRRTVWPRLVDTAQAEIAATLRALPREVSEQARTVPVTYDPLPNDALLADGWEPDLLGLFVGVSYAQEGHTPCPQQIFLFLENLWEEAGHDEIIYREEVRKTYLHELGHYLGLDEGELDERGLR
jgi:predicted Zn-dependent protease with MMP-like domain